MSWASYRTIMANARKVWTADEDFIRLGEVVIDTPLIKPFLFPLRALFTAKDVFRWLAAPKVGTPQQLFACIDMAYEDLEANRVALVITMKEGYPLCQEYFLITKGTIEVLPEVLGFGVAAVEMQAVEGGYRYDIQLPRRQGLLARVRRALSWPFSGRALARELSEAYALLNERHADLEAKNTELALRNEALERSTAERMKVEEALRENARQLALARDAAEEASRAKGAFLATMSHEIRTPMTTILGYTDLLIDGSLDDTQREFMAIIQRSGHHLLALINDILDYSKIEAERIELEQRSIVPRTLVAESMGMVRPQAEAKGLRLTSSMAEGLPHVLIGDEVRLRQVLVNLLSNAIKFTEQGAVHLSLGGERVGEGAFQLQAAVRDTGIGIDQARLEELFTPFVQADASMTRQYGGTGLGLAISQRLAAMMDGRIWADSVPGEGSTFYVQVRLGISAVATEGRKTLAKTPDKAPVPLRVLVVEDEPMNRALFEYRLKTIGHEVAVATDGFEALAALESSRYDAILMDIQMPGLDGMEVTRRIRTQTSLTPQPHIIACTAFALSGDRERFLKAGMDAYLSKPFTTQELVDVLRQLET